MAPSILFGDISDVQVEDLRPVLLKYGIKRLDTAAFYGGGSSERRMGEANLEKEFIIDTKIMSGPMDDGMLSPEKVEESSKQSLERLRTEQVNVLYCHLPDHITPLEEQVRGLDNVYQKGRFKEVGLITTVFDRPEFHSAYENLRSVSEKTGIGTGELSLRWLMYHSQLQDGDVIILGASKIQQIEDTMQKLQKGRLDSDVAQALNELWTRDLEAGAMEIVNPAKWKFW